MSWHKIPLSQLFRLTRELFVTDRITFTLILSIRAVRALIPVILLYIAKIIIDSISQGSVRTSQVLFLVGYEAGLVLVNELLAHLSDYYENRLAIRFNTRMSLKMMSHTAKLDFKHFEDASFSDQLERARRQSFSRISLIVHLLNLFQNITILITLGINMMLFGLWVLLIPLAFIVPTVLAEIRFEIEEYKFNTKWTQKQRYLSYLLGLSIGERSAKEVIVFHILPWLQERYRRISSTFADQNDAMALDRARLSSAMSAVAIIGFYVGYVRIIQQTIAGVYTIGTFVLLASSYSKFRELLYKSSSSISSLCEQALYLKDLFTFFETESNTSTGNKVRLPLRKIETGMKFENVSFKYPHSDRWVIRNISFELRVGEKVAVIGENGAGKTTIIKLILRLYEPTEGRILLNGIDLGEYDLESLRKTVTVLFQDFMRFDFRFDENIGIGDIEGISAYMEDTHDVQSDEQPSTESAEMCKNPPIQIQQATTRANAQTLLPKLRRGYQQILGNRFAEGVGLSGGEWQKVALARALMKQSQIVVLDEPTSSLDVVATEKYQEMFSEFVRDKISVTITHRISLIRKSDKIIVLRNGSIVEEGTHQELISIGGLYKTMCEKQSFPLD